MINNNKINIYRHQNKLIKYGKSSNYNTNTVNLSVIDIFFVFKGDD